jgi:hypothetical protein
MTDFDYGLAKHAIRITSDRSDCVFFWFWPQTTGIRDRMIAAAKQDLWEARQSRRGPVISGERRGKQCDLTIDELRAWKGLVRVLFECEETTTAVLAWAMSTVSSLSMTVRSFQRHPLFTENQPLTGKIANEVRSCDTPPFHRRQCCLRHLRL